MLRLCRLGRSATWRRPWLVTRGVWPSRRSIDGGTTHPLANGTALTVSNELHPDLFWGLRGAGHNFGIVTEIKYKIYDVGENSNWTYEAFTFTADKLEELYTLANEIMDKQPPQAVNFAAMVLVPLVDPVNVSHIFTLSALLMDISLS